MTEQHECAECGDSFDSKRGLHIHIGEVHPDKKEELFEKDDKQEKEGHECGECGKSFDSRNGLHIHIGEMHPDKKEELFEQDEDEEEHTEEEKEEDEQPGFFRRYVLNNPLRMILAVALIAIAVLALSQANLMDGAPEDYTQEEVGERIGELLEMNPDMAQAETEIVSTEDTDSGVYLVQASINFDGQEEIIDVYGSKDGKMFFPQGIEQEDQDNEEIIEEEAGQLAAEQVRLLFEQQELGMEIETEFVESLGVESGVYKVQIELSAPNVPSETLESYVTKDGRLVFPEGHDIDFMMEEFEALADFDDDTVEESDYEPGDDDTEDMDELVDCLDEQDVKIYGMETCPACTELAEGFGGYDVIDPIYVECLEDQARCEEEMEGESVPEIHFEDYVTAGVMTPEEFAQETGCDL